jgi:hypothetical protein
VPDEFEAETHNNKVLGIDLKGFGRAAYLVFIAYYGFLGFLQYRAWDHVWHTDLTEQAKQLNRAPKENSPLQSKGLSGSSAPEYQSPSPEQIPARRPPPKSTAKLPTTQRPPQ